MSVTEHKKAGQSRLGFMVLTVSDTRTTETDKSGRLIYELLEENGHQVVLYEIVKDEQVGIEAALQKGCNDERVAVIITNGGTGLAERDVTVEVVERMIARTIPGYGELFRMLSYQEIGSAAMLSKATAGIVGRTVIFATPGSTGAVRLAMENLILPEVGHIVSELQKDFPG